MTDANTVEPSSDLCQLLSCLPEKFVVDFANGIDVARERQRHLSTRIGLFARLFDGFTGQGARHQAEITASLTDGVEGALNWLVDLTQSQVKSNRALYQVHCRVNGLMQDVTTLANYSADTRQALERLTQVVGDRFGLLELEVARLGSVQRARAHLDGVMSKWGAGRFNGLSFTGRCYAVLEELRWGAFGDHCQGISGQERQQLLEELANRAVMQLSLDARVTQTERIATRDRWLARPTAKVAWYDGEQALAYLGDWSCPHNSPLTFAISQMPEVLPLQVPRLGSAQRMTEGLISELFLETSI